MRKIASGIQSSQGRSRAWSGARLVNCFAELAEGDKADLFAVMAIPGLAEFSSIGTLGNRGEHVMGGVLYVVNGTTLYSVASDGTETPIGSIPGSLPVQMADNGSQLAIQADTEGYVLDSGTIYSNIVNLGPVSGVTYIDGYFVWLVADSDQFIISGLNDGLTYDPLDVATVEGNPDNNVGVINDHRELQFYGAQTVEIWYNSGDADFPFERQGNAFIERGLRDRNSLVKIDNSVHFVGDDLVVYRLSGYEPVRISTHAIEGDIAGASWFRAFTYTLHGHKFYVLNTNIGTFAYDMATGAWHDRRSLGRANYRVGFATSCYGRTIMADAYTGKLYVPSLSVNTEDGDEIPMEILLPSVQSQRAKQTLYSYECQLQAGVGNSVEADPQMILQYSRDGGNTWSPELTRAMGKVGEYLTRAIWRLGVQFYQLQLRLKMPAKAQRFIITHWADIR
ncbi:hypothetical protein [Sphingopyxis sp. JAI128]|uniref:hypothetical protein n=1 Tax=Sphingopyxis sp. JAI128 TaxID=2723066 RepID=UPI00161829DA|nr:hypothetical protein [Sphingopyxis sp. JAI128]MBB6424943.1 hypothetical protein [Sphingopyxis sp. JAI128]